MEVILDELTPFEFFSHGGVVKLTINNQNLIRECDLKKKYTFFDYKSYVRFFRLLYVSFLHNHSEYGVSGLYRYVNSNISLYSTIGSSEYVVDLEYCNTSSYETAKFYYSGDRIINDLSPRDPYGIRNVCFSKVTEDNENWTEFTKERYERGFDDSELWDLDGTISKFIYPRLLEFKKIKNIHPEGMSNEDWNNILDEMISGFELLSLDRYKTDDEISTQKRAVELLCRHYFDLCT